MITVLRIALREAIERDVHYAVLTVVRISYGSVLITQRDKNRSRKRQETIEVRLE